MANKTKYSLANKQVDIKAVKRLLAERGERGWTVAKLAYHIGYARSTVHNVLVGKSKSPHVLTKVAAALDVPLQAILLSAPESVGNGQESTPIPQQAA